MRYFILLLLCGLPFLATAQQLPDAGQVVATNFIWNPAMTAPFDYWEVAGFYRQQWVGFEDAPRTTGVGMQYPFVNQNMSIGAFIQHDQVHPLHSNSISFTYAYKLRFLDNHQLSIGALASMAEYHINAEDIIVNTTDDNLIPLDGSSQIKPNVGVGLYYQSNIDGDFDETYYYAGIASNQLLGTNLLFEDGTEGNFKRVLHGNAIMGLRIIKDRFALEPALWVNFAEGGRYNTNFRLQAEYLESFWGGVSFATSGMATFQAGVMLKNGVLKDGLLRIGVLAAYNVGSLGMFQGVGYEGYIAYRFYQE